MTTSESPTHPDAPRAGGETPDTRTAQPILSPEIRAAIGNIEADTCRLRFGEDRTKPLATIYELLSATREQGVDIPEAMTTAMFGDGYQLSHQRRLLAIALATALKEIESLRADEARTRDYIISCPWCSEKMGARPARQQINHLIDCGDRSRSALLERHRDGERESFEARVGRTTLAGELRVHRASVTPGHFVARHVPSSIDACELSAELAIRSVLRELDAAMSASPDPERASPPINADDSRGHKSTSPCEKCGAMEVYVAQDSDDDADFTIHCNACGMHYRADGPDA